jgi:hypothetical protein
VEPGGTPAPAPAAVGPQTPGPAAVKPEAPEPAAVRPSEPANLLEDAARAALEEVKRYAADPNVPRYEVLRLYQENVIDVYSKTKAAAEAAEAIKQLKAEAADGKSPKKAKP